MPSSTEISAHSPDWQYLLRVLLAIIAIAVMVLVGSGAIVLLQSVHR
jgi:hypothetical protein